MTAQWSQTIYEVASNALSFSRSKMILDRPNHFGWVAIDFDWSNLFWSCPNHFGQVQIIKISQEKSNLTLTKMLWALTKTIRSNFKKFAKKSLIWPRPKFFGHSPKRFGPDQNNWYSTKMIWSVQNHFGAIEGHGIRDILCFFMASKIESFDKILWNQCDIKFKYCAWEGHKIWKNRPLFLRLQTK